MESSTSVSLLLRIKNDSTAHSAWRSFVERYGSRIMDWCQNRKLDVNDAEDVTQEILLKLAKQLKSFEYDCAGSFRGWLRRVTENAIRDFFAEQKKRRTALPPEWTDLESTPATKDLYQRLQSAFDLELMEMAILRVSERVKDHRLAAWQLCAVDGLSGREASERLGIRIASVYTAKQQVQTMIQEEIRKLEQEQGEI